MGLIAFFGAAVAAIVYTLRSRGSETRFRTLGVVPSSRLHAPGAVAAASAGAIRARSESRSPLVGNRGWLLLYMLALGAELAHGLALTIGSLVVYANPSLAGLDSFIPLWALLIYVVSNLALVAYGVVLFGLMLSKRRSAILNNILFNALSVTLLLTWLVLGAKSPVGTIVDSLPGLVAIAYFSRSRRVRSTYTAT